MKKLSVKEVEQLSKCCKSPLYIVGEVGGTRWYQCTKCYKPSDPSETNIGVGTKEMIEKAAKYSNEKQAELANEAPVMEPHLSAYPANTNYTPYLKEFDKDLMDLLVLKEPAIHKFIALKSLWESSIERARREVGNELIKELREYHDKFPDADWNDLIGYIVGLRSRYDKE